MDAALQAVLWEQLGAMLSEPESSKSQPVAPINRLPSEILAMIFTLASNRCIIHDETDSGSQLVMPTIFSSVCGLWRQISLSTCSLWSHLDISMKIFEYGVPCHRWELWESRSRPGPLSVHISDEGFTWGREAAEAMVTEIVSFLTPHMTRVSEIHVTSCKSKFPNYMLDVLALWAREGAAKPARLLKIGDHKSAFGDINLRGRLSHTAQPVTTDNFEAFFQSLHTLHLHRAFIPWDSSVYYGLVDLYLTAGAHSPQQWFPTQSQLARVLAACPKLRSLRLIDFTVRLDRDLIPSPIILDHLEVLSLLQPNSFDYKIMKRVLPLIGSSSSSFEVSLKLNMETDFTAITRSFFSRCNLTRLHLSAQNLPVQCILPLLAGHVPRLETLSLKRFDFTDGTTQQRTAMGVNPTSDSWPQLRELHLIRCVLNSDHGQIRRLLQHYPIRKLYLSNCTRKYGTPAELMKEIEAVRCLAKRLGVLEVVTKDGDDDDNGGSGDEDDDDEI